MILKFIFITWIIQVISMDERSKHKDWTTSSPSGFLVFWYSMYMNYIIVGRTDPKLLHFEVEAGTRRSKTSPNEQTREVGCESWSWKLENIWNRGILTKYNASTVLPPMDSDFPAHFWIAISNIGLEFLYEDKWDTRSKIKHSEFRAPSFITFANTEPPLYGI